VSRLGLATVDAALIARFCKGQSPEPWIPPPAEIRVLQALMRHCDHLKKTRAQQSVYAQSSDSTVVAASIREVIATLDEQIAQVERKIRQHFDNHPDLKRRRDLLTSIPGIASAALGGFAQARGLVNAQLGGIAVWPAGMS
jgi:hypothetical protein